MEFFLSGRNGLLPPRTLFYKQARHDCADEEAYTYDTHSGMVSSSDCL